jgi:hypothetical protein
LNFLCQSVFEATIETPIQLSAEWPTGHRPSPPRVPPRAACDLASRPAARHVEEVPAASSKPPSHFFPSRAQPRRKNAAPPHRHKRRRVRPPWHHGQVQFPPLGASSPNPQAIPPPDLASRAVVSNWGRLRHCRHGRPPCRRGALRGRGS